jgi:2-amino-4-hydroxy-6-hydroxymethyldihydropteridine diphosphokinase
MPKRVFVSLGSNIEKERNLPEAIRLLAERCRLVAVSKVYETTPVGYDGQPSFLNAAVLIETSLDAAAFRQQILNQIEQQLNRVRTADKFAPRTIDADIILYDEDVLDLDAHHHIPDPDLLRFAYVAVPIADLDPGMRHPETGEGLGQIAQRLRNEAGAAAFWERGDIRLDVNPSSQLERRTGRS